MEIPSVEMIAKDTNGLDAALNQEIYDLSLIHIFGHPHNHPLMAVHKTEYSQRLKFDLESIIRAYTCLLYTSGLSGLSY